jgi:hypothetical protein
MIIRTLPLRSLELVLRQSCRQQQPHGVRIHGSVLKVRGFHLSVAARDREFDPRSIERESDEVDVCIVGGGPAGLSAAIRLKQLAAKEDREIRVLLLEKGSEMGMPVSPSSFLPAPLSSTFLYFLLFFLPMLCVGGAYDRGTYTLWGGDTNGRFGRVISRLEGKST